MMRALECAAITPGLQSIVVFDAPYTVLETMGLALSKMLEAATGKEIERVHLGVSEQDDDLWGRLSIVNVGNGQSVDWQRGLLDGTASNSRILLAIIPDLAKLSLSAARSCVMLIGSDVVHLERYGQHKYWRPKICWLASCAKAEVGALSPHLLDRFSLRLNWSASSLDRKDRGTDWLKRVLSDPNPDEIVDYSLPKEVREQIQTASQTGRVLLTREALSHILDYIPTTESQTQRRTIALARLAQALAQINGQSQITADHVTDAAHLIGLLYSKQPVEEPPEKKGIQQPSTSTSSGVHDSGDNTPILSTTTAALDDADSPRSLTEAKPALEDVYESDQPEEWDEFSITGNPYPEDEAPIMREVASLQLPLHHSSETRVGRGIVVGVEQATSPSDLAITGTIFAAAPFQRIRRDQLKQRQQHIDDHNFLLSRKDLRSYRRIPAPEQMVIVLVDYTGLRECDWQQTLLPYLRTAYIERASICIVQVGADTATNELQAELVNERSILVPSIAEALQARAGRATPLAHGLDMMLRTLIHALQHGRSTLRHATLIVISDGRGNVPLEASRSGRITDVALVNREGIEDALQVAQQIRSLKGVQKRLLLNPKPKYYSELPYTLAQTLGADIVDIPPRRTI